MAVGKMTSLGASALEQLLPISNPTSQSDGGMSLLAIGLRWGHLLAVSGVGI